jgi:hypothetical protein
MGRRIGAAMQAAFQAAAALKSDLYGEPLSHRRALCDEK